MCQAPGATSRPTVDDVLDHQRNAIGLLRLGFAGTVLISHSWTLGGFGREPLQHGPMTLGTLGVCGFFALSGFLITQSAARQSLTRYAWNRFLRIAPAYWVCLVLICFVAAPLAYLDQHGTLAGFLTTQDGPLRFLGHNALLHIGQYGVSGTPSSVPYSGPGMTVWDGSLYTLFPELECYLLVGFLARTGILLRHRWITPSAALLTALGLLAHVGHHRYVTTVLLDANLRFAFCFFVGATLWLYRERIPLTAPLALTALAISALLLLSDHWDASAGALFTTPPSGPPARCPSGASGGTATSPTGSTSTPSLSSRSWRWPGCSTRASTSSWSPASRVLSPWLPRAGTWSRGRR